MKHGRQALFTNVPELMAELKCAGYGQKDPVDEIQESIALCLVIWIRRRRRTR